MRLELWSIAKKRSQNIFTPAIEAYENRLKKYVAFDRYVFMLDYPVNMPSETVKKREADYILQKIAKNPTAKIILLEEKGTQYTSVRWAQEMRQMQNAGTKKLIFIIGGYLGWHSDMLTRSYELWSLSELTFPHQMVSLLMVEQLYRVYTILKGEKYHH